MWMALKPVFVVFLIGFAAYGAGVWIVTALPVTFSRFDKFVCAWLGGLGLLSSALFLIGQWKFTRPIIAVVMLLGILAAVRPIGKLFIMGNAWRSKSQIPKLPAAVVLCVLFLTAVAGLVEITGDWGSDTVAYHLLGPKVWIREGVIRPVPDNCHTAFPQVAETLYAVAMAFGGPRAPGFSNFLTFGMLLLAAGALAMGCGLDATGAWWVAALVATMPAVYTGSTGGFIDGLYAAFVLVAVRVGFEARSFCQWAIFGLFCGLAMATKYPGLLALPVLLCCAMLVKALEGQFEWTFAKSAGMAFAVACFVAAPYYLRNWILLGSPIYPPPPLLSRWFPAKYLSPEVITQFHAYIFHRGAGFGRGLTAFLSLPFNLTYHTSNFHGAGGIGIVGLALAPFGIIASRRSSFANALAVLSFLLVCLWFATQQESRFLIHMYVISAVFAMLGWRYVVSLAPRYSRLLAGTVVAVSVSYGLFMIVRARSADLRAVFSSTFANERRHKEIPFLDSFEFLNHEPAVRRVLLLDRSIPPFYLDREYVKPVGQWGERTLPGAPDAAEALIRVREWNVSHVLDVQSPIAPFQVAAGTRGLTLVFESKEQRIYRVD
jgi:hypothetical protein